MTIETEAEIEALRKIGRIVADCLQFMGSKLEPGMTTREVDALGTEFLARHGARSAPKLTYNFPGTTCISLNNEVAHGVPGDRKIAAGDLVNIDVSAELDGFFADTGASFSVPPENRKKTHLLHNTRLALATAMKAARAGAPLNGIGAAIESVADRAGLTIIENLGSHGVGRGLHEEPEFIAPFHDPRDKRTLRKGQVITIEPFLSTGAREAIELADGWTWTTAKRYLSAQFEHTMIITNGEPLIMTLPSP
jgi:methionyl aminopeptidase